MFHYVSYPTHTRNLWLRRVLQDGFEEWLTLYSII